MRLFLVPLTIRVPHSTLSPVFELHFSIWFVTPSWWILVPGRAGFASGDPGAGTAGTSTAITTQLDSVPCGGLADYELMEHACVEGERAWPRSSGTQAPR